MEVGQYSSVVVLILFLWYKVIQHIYIYIYDMILGEENLVQVK